MRRLKSYLFITVVLTLVSSCVTQKKRDDVSKVGKMYHDITSKYNRNFNANVLIDETLAQLQTTQQEDYSKVLAIYPFVDKENPTQLAEPMDKAIEKASVAIAIHRPSHWTDDNYMIIGRAQYIKEDFESAENTFRYIVKHYDPHNLIAASAQKSRNVNKKLTDKEKAQKRKEVEKERDEKVKERKKEIKRNKKERERNAKKAKLARIKERKQEIKDRERLAKSNNAAKTSNPVDSKSDVADAKDNKKKKQKPFDDNPQLPKVKGDPDNYFLKHKPAFQEAQLWLAKTLIERDRFGEAENILRSLENNENTFKEIREEIYPAQAHSALSRGQVAAAIEPLSKAVENTSDRQKRARYAFILAQVLENTNRESEALAAYDQVVKLKPNYEMTFNAQLSKLKMQASTGDITADKYADLLNRMIKDDKNREYQDQLYFTLAQQELKSGNKAEAIAKLTESIRNSAGNNVQKAESYYTLADLYFEDDDYVKAKYYFDSTQMVMSKNDPRYDQVLAYSKNLSEIAHNLEIIELQDSLLQISQLSDKELKQLAAEIKKKQIQEDAAKEAAAANTGNKSNIPALNSATQSIALGQQGGSVFFAYDDRALKKGQRDFSRTWGDIGLQDNWRRSSASGFGVIASESTGEVQDNTIGPISETEIDEIFKDVPRTPEQKAQSEKKIEDALFELGRHFRSELSDAAKSAESLETLLDKFPSTEHALDAYYLLYVDYVELGNSQKAALYRDKILDGYADSDYAKYIKDPSILQNALTDDEKAEQYYRDVYGLFDEGQYDQALKQLIQAKSNLPAKHNLLSKFSFLTALCIGKIQGREPYVNALKETIAKYPNTDEEERAKEIIRLLGIRFTETSDGIEEINPEAYFTLTEDDKLHMVLVALKSDADGQQRNEARVKISDYNKKYHSLDKLTISMILIGEDSNLPLLVIRRFDTREKAMAYFDGVQKNSGEFLGDPSTYEIFAASQTNYRKIVQLKSVDLYRDFFVKEYLSK